MNPTRQRRSELIRTDGIKRKVAEHDPHGRIGDLKDDPKLAAVVQWRKLIGCLAQVD